MKKILLISAALAVTQATASDYTLLNANAYAKVVAQSRQQIMQLLQALKPYRKQSLNRQVAFLAEQLSDIPYLHYGIGEGDWQPRAQQYRPGALHVNQQPVYRLDGLDCQSYVETILALLNAQHLNQFDQQFLQIGYGAAGNPDGEVVHYYNRNHFVEADFNRINQRHGLITDVTRKGELAQYSQNQTATITRLNWFKAKRYYLRKTVQVLNREQAGEMKQRFLNDYTKLSYPHFDREKITLSYLPKALLAFPIVKGRWEPNTAVLDKIPTPAIVEIVNNSARWFINGINIKTLIGSELMVSHLGILFRKKFNQGDVIYQQITCYKPLLRHEACFVRPVRCGQAQCSELMFTHASNVYPNNYFWYQDNAGNYHCAATLPKQTKRFSYCNRIETLPFFAYLTASQHSNAPLRNPAILGVHIEQLL